MEDRSLSSDELFLSLRSHTFYSDWNPLVYTTNADSEIVLRNMVQHDELMSQYIQVTLDEGCEGYAEIARFLCKNKKDYHKGNRRLRRFLKSRDEEDGGRDKKKDNVIELPPAAKEVFDDPISRKTIENLKNSSC